MLSDYHRIWLTEKGIDPDFAVGNYKLVSEGDTVKFPYPNGTIKFRHVVADEPRTFASKGPIGLFHADLMTDSKTLFICEGETDAMCLAQYVGTGIVTGISGVNGWKPDFKSNFQGAETVYVILDNDLDYNKTDKAWEAIRADLGKKAVRVYLPPEVKDVCEFFDNFLPVDLSTYLAEAKERKGKFHYPALDLNGTPPEYDWLVAPYIARGDVCLFLGESNTGKSMLVQDLAVAIACGRTHWLGLEINPANPRVYVIDEENPEDVIYHRLLGLGLTPSGAANIRYVSDAGVRLDNRTAKLVLDEAMAFEPGLIIIDSLTRVHTSAENDAGAMAKVFNDGIKPLARATGAAVLVLHHETKGDSTNAYIKARGTSDIPASVDSGIRISKVGGNFKMSQFKTRRTSIKGGGILWKIEDTQDGISISTIGSGIASF